MSRGAGEMICGCFAFAVTGKPLLSTDPMRGRIGVLVDDGTVPRRRLSIKDVVSVDPESV